MHNFGNCHKKSGNVYSVYIGVFKLLNQKSDDSFPPLSSNLSLCVRKNVETFPDSQGAVVDMACLQAMLLVRTDKWKKVWAILVSELCLDLVVEAKRASQICM